MPLFLTPEAIAASQLSHDTLETIRNCAYRVSIDLYNKQTDKASAYYGRIVKEGSLSHKQEDNLLALLSVHRALHHIGYWWEAYSPDWFATCWLYLHLYRYELPDALAEKDMVEVWKNRPKGRLEAAAVEIRTKIHSLTHSSPSQRGPF